MPLITIDKLLDAGTNRLFYTILNQRFIHEGKHLLGLRTRNRQEPGAPSRRRDDRSTHFHLLLLTISKP